MSTETKDRLPLRMEPETKRKIDQWYEAVGCRSKNQFVEQAVNFYADHLAMQDNSLLPMMAWSAGNEPGYLNKTGIEKIKSALTNDIFRQEMFHIYEQKSQSRDELV